VDALDNMMWHALSGAQRHFAEGDELARRYPVAVGPFSAVPDEPRDEHFDALRALVGPGNVATLLRGELSAPVGWDVLGTIDAVQMVGPTSNTPAEDPRICLLGAEDVEEMVSLVARTKPGPFAQRTWELGTYLGVRIDGRLVAMAGQRAQTNDHIEVSAVCTDAEYVGRGLGGALVMAQVELIVAAGKRPMLHTASNNVRAIALYVHLGFELRRSVGGLIARAPL
jgi:ribosomal protein S18 acetylase RimI-like enzyme